MHWLPVKVWWTKFFTNALASLVLVISKSEEEYALHMRKVLKVLCKHQLYAKLSKCHFAKHKFQYLGHVVDKEGIKVDLAMPCDVGKLCSFIGLCNYFIRFIQGYSTLVAPLTILAQQNVKYEWIGECQSFRQSEVCSNSRSCVSLYHIRGTFWGNMWFSHRCGSFARRETNSFWKSKAFPYGKELYR